MKIGVVSLLGVLVAALAILSVVYGLWGLIDRRRHGERASELRSSAINPGWSALIFAACALYLILSL